MSTHEHAARSTPSKGSERVLERVLKGEVSEETAAFALDISRYELASRLRGLVRDRSQVLSGGGGVDASGVAAPDGTAPAEE